MKSEEIEIANRVIRIVTLSGSQTISVYSEDEVPGERIYKIRDTSRFVSASKLDSQGFASLEELDEHLRADCGAMIKSKP